MPNTDDENENPVNVLIGREEHRAAKIASAVAGLTLRDWLDEIIRAATKNGDRRKA